MHIFPIHYVYKLDNYLSKSLKGAVLLVSTHLIIPQSRSHDEF